MEGYSPPSFFLSRKIRFLNLGQELYTVKGNAHTSSDLAVRRAMGLSLVLFCTVFGDGPISGMTVEQQDAKNKGFFQKIQTC